MRAALIASLLTVILAGCVRPGDDRARLDDEVGTVDSPPVSIVVADGQAHVRTLDTAGAILWSQAPTFTASITNDGDQALAGFSLLLLNVPIAAELTVLTEGGPPPALTLGETGRPTSRQLSFELPPRSRVELRVADSRPPGPFRVVVMGDIQEALPDVDEVFAAINDTPDIDFVVSTGDIVEAAKDEEYELYEDQLRVLDVPMYSTIGNHELRRDPENWHRRFGRYNVHFEYRDVVFTFVDSGNASIDPIVTGRLGEWLDVGRDRIHLVGTHYPPFDPIGGRQASFRSRKEASAFLSRLAGGNVDATFYGHIHSYYAFDNAGIPAFISGGGGAFPEQLDNVGRHFLVVDCDATTGRTEVGLVRVD